MISITQQTGKSFSPLRHDISSKWGEPRHNTCSSFNTCTAMSFTCTLEQIQHQGNCDHCHSPSCIPKLCLASLQLMSMLRAGSCANRSKPMGWAFSRANWTFGMGWIMVPLVKSSDLCILRQGLDLHLVCAWWIRAWFTSTADNNNIIIITSSSYSICVIEFNIRDYLEHWIICRYHCHWPPCTMTQRGREWCQWQQWYCQWQWQLAAVTEVGISRGGSHCCVGFFFASHSTLRHAVWVHKGSRHTFHWSQNPHLVRWRLWSLLLTSLCHLHASRWGEPVSIDGKRMAILSSDFSNDKSAQLASCTLGGRLGNDGNGPTVITRIVLLGWDGVIGIVSLGLCHWDHVIGIVSLGLCHWDDVIGIVHWDHVIGIVSLGSCHWDHAIECYMQWGLSTCRWVSCFRAMPSSVICKSPPLGT